MNITANHIEYKKNIGTLRGKPVYEVLTTGGFHLIVVSSVTGLDPIGTGPHAQVARFIAKRREPDLVITDIRKSDYVDPSCFQHLLPEWESKTDLFRTEFLK